MVPEIQTSMSMQEEPDESRWIVLLAKDEESDDADRRQPRREAPSDAFEASSVDAARTIGHRPASAEAEGISLRAVGRGRRRASSAPVRSAVLAARLASRRSVPEAPKAVAPRPGRTHAAIAET